ncbi:hypothetical protein BpHYR1_025137 [Brachionus plicatilis]|uniref:Uncharacterized protein n=1 Tax=Brachionus plicatilis TaxID=10195 RepID=A0A3M7RRT0_BRAPC|nr:hypothetical protein BpHYR1_025137 [Brachionus plicatilis]
MYFTIDGHFSLKLFVNGSCLSCFFEPFQLLKSFFNEIKKKNRNKRKKTPFLSDSNCELIGIVNHKEDNLNSCSEVEDDFSFYVVKSDLNQDILFYFRHTKATHNLENKEISKYLVSKYPNVLNQIKLNIL